MTDEQGAGVQLETPIYESRRQVLMSIVVANSELVQYHLEQMLAHAPWKLGPPIAWGLKKSYGIGRRDLWKLPLRLLSDITDEQFDAEYNRWFPFFRDL